MSKKDEETTAKYLIQMPDELHMELKLYSIKNKKTIRECIIEAIKKYLNN